MFLIEIFMNNSGGAEKRDIKRRKERESGRWEGGFDRNSRSDLSERA